MVLEDVGRGDEMCVFEDGRVQLVIPRRGLLFVHRDAAGMFAIHTGAKIMERRWREEH